MLKYLKNYLNTKLNIIYKMIKDKNSLREENIHFTYNVEFSKFLCETNKEKIEKKFPISLNKESFDYYLYVHRVFFFF